MKKEERLHRLFGDIDDDLVADAAAKPIPLKVWLPRVTAAVAAVALTVGLAIAQPWASEKPPVTAHTDSGNKSNSTTTAQQNAPDGEEIGVPTDVAPPVPTQSQKGTTTVTTTAEGTPDIWYEQPWEEWPTWQKFNNFLRDPDQSYEVQAALIDTAYVEAYLEEVTLEGVDGPNNTIHTTTARIYRITGVSDTAAVALQYEGESTYYPAVNRNYSPDTLGDLLTDFNLREYLRIGVVYETPINKDVRQFHGLTLEAMWELLMQQTDLPNAQKDGSITPEGTRWSIEASIPILGNYQLYGIGIWGNGYLDMSFGNTRKTFYIGKDAVDAFAAYLQEHCRIVTTTTSQIDLSGDTTADNGTTRTSPAQPPLTTRHTVKG